MLKIQDLTLKSGDRTILRKINLTVKAGEIYGILGPNHVSRVFRQSQMKSTP